MNATLKQMIEGLGELTSKEIAELVRHIQRIADEGSRMDEGHMVNEHNWKSASILLERAVNHFEAIR